VKSGVLFASALLACAPAGAATMTAKDFNLFALNTVTEQGSDTEGRVAVGGNAVFKPYTVGAVLSNSGTNLVVGGNLDQQYGSFTGSVFVGGNATLNGVGVNGNITANGKVKYTNGTLKGNIASGSTVTTASAGVSGTIKQNQAQVASPVDFSAEAIRLKGLSKLYSSYAAGNLPANASLGSVLFDSNSHTVTLTGTGSGINVFNISGSLLPQDWGTFNINLTGGGQALINVSGTSQYWTGGMNVNGSSAGSGGANVLFNFYQATNITFGSIGVLGSILAPLATYNDAAYGSLIKHNAGGVINGQVVVANWNGTYSSNTQINNVFLRDYAIGKNLLGDPYTPPPVKQAAVPEPSTWATMVAGFGLLGGAMRRRRKPAFA